jgi:hypothetical protein
VVPREEGGGALLAKFPCNVIKLLLYRLSLILSSNSYTFHIYKKLPVIIPSSVPPNFWEPKPGEKLTETSIQIAGRIITLRTTRKSYIF